MMDKQKFVRLKLKAYYQRARELNLNFSERAFACKLGISPSTYSEFKFGKRPMSEDLLSKLISIIKLTEEEIAVYQSLPLKQKKKILELATCSSASELKKNFAGLKSDQHFTNIIYCQDVEHFYFIANDSVEAKLLELTDEYKEKIATLVENLPPEDKKCLYEAAIHIKTTQKT